MSAEMEKYWFVFYENKLVLSRDGEVMVSPLPPLNVKVGMHPHEISELDGRACLAYETDSVPDDSRWRLVTLRDSFSLLDRRFYDKAGMGAELLFWDASTQFCGRCGGRTQRETVIMKRCVVCGALHFTHVSPAIIVLVHKGDSVLMVRAHNFRGSHFGLVAGFVDPGESLEECVHREVLEETGLQIANVRYFGSQPWPYPCGVMIGFHADYVSGEIRIQESELQEAHFFSRDALPELPGKLSLARRLVDGWLASAPIDR